jgi:gas vesicle protein
MGRHHHKDDTVKKIAIGGTIAAVAGFVAGILAAPKSGKETRNDIKAAADKGITEAEKDLKKIHAELDKAISGAKDNGEKLSAKAQKERDSLLEKAQDTREKAREMLNAVREGETDDRDLKKAIKDANAAIDHLKDYIKK